MPYALVTIGLLMIVTGINNTYSQFGTQLQNDFTGSNGGSGFFAWVIALFAVGALGYINDLRQFSHYFMALILISMILANKGVFAQFEAAIKAGPTAPTANTATTQSTALSPQSSTSQLNSAITSNQTGPFGSQPSSAGQAKAFGWLNYIFGLGTNSSGNAQ